MTRLPRTVNAHCINSLSLMSLIMIHLGIIIVIVIIGEKADVHPKQIARVTVCYDRPPILLGSSL